MLISRLRARINKFLGEISREDRTVMLICLGIAFFFWGLVKLSQSYTTEKEVVLQFEIPTQKAFVEPPNDIIPVAIRGTGWNLFFEFVASRQILLDYDVGAADYFSLSRSQFRSDVLAGLSSKDITIEDINFDGLRLSLEDRANIKVPIDIPNELVFVTDYHLAEPLFSTPDSVLIIGPESAIQDIQSWPTDTLKLSALKTNFSGKIALQAPSASIRLEPEVVQVEARVEPYTQKSVFVDVTVLNPPEDSIRIFPEKIKVNCVVGLQHYQNLTGDDFKLVADLSQTLLNEGKNTVSLELVEQPNYVRNVLLSRRSAEFFIIKREEPASEDSTDAPEDDQ